MVMVAYSELLLSGLDNVIADNIFNKTIPAYNALSLDDRVTNGSYSIPIDALEDRSKLHNEILKKYPPTYATVLHHSGWYSESELRCTADNTQYI